MALDTVYVPGDSIEFFWTDPSDGAECKAVVAVREGFMLIVARHDSGARSPGDFVDWLVETGKAEFVETTDLICLDELF